MRCSGLQVMLARELLMRHRAASMGLLPLPPPEPLLLEAMNISAPLHRIYHQLPAAGDPVVRRTITTACPTTSAYRVPRAVCRVCIWALCHWSH
jgi:hypothetical protein